MTIENRRNRRLRDVARRFASDTRGNIAMISAFVIPVLLLITFGGIDIHRASTVKANLQDALDAATLAAARSPYTGNTDITRVGLASLRANLAPYSDITLLTAQTTFALDTSTGAVVGDAKVNVTALVANIILPMVGRGTGDQIPVGARSEVLRSNNRVEVALVLDNTGSMSGAKLTNTKAAAIDLIDRLEAADSRSIEPDAIKISLVPFSQTVRISAGGSNTVPSYMSNATTHTGGGAWNASSNPTSLFSAARGRFTLFGDIGATWGGCVESRPAPYDIRDDGPSGSTQTRLFVPYFAPDQPDEGDYPNDWTWVNYADEGNDYLEDARNGNNSTFASTTARENEWGLRLRNRTKYASAYKRSGSYSTSWGPNRGCNLQPLIRLTDDYDALRTAVNNMIASGNTNVPLGTMWGWHTLSPNAPFGDGRAYGTERLTKIIIIMTDGENVMSDASNPNRGTYSGMGYIYQNRLGITSGSDSQRRTAMDNRFDHPTAGVEDMCGNMKDQDIEVYTVAVQVDGTAQTLLRRCATDDDHYFPVDNAGGIGAAFDRIAGAIENLRISR
ncbi:TadE/TadG family type IV pilus assembly protein [Brevundimonas sp.]|uniref:TadE/TadG family type IV pilus assembly protein n=1 Tax=Brevundimonas sp. TaxID=1871086 RepID=UPI00261301A5|nr:TadE/TadG family type IV pilus assembly protein [Brevundimonas sp.]